MRHQSRGRWKKVGMERTDSFLYFAKFGAPYFRFFKIVLKFFYLVFLLNPNIYEILAKPISMATLVVKSREMRPRECRARVHGQCLH